MKSLTFRKGLISMKQSNFHIINAAAGSGKTYTLVLYYLTTLLGSNNSRPYRMMLALTFTNKAVNEMKARILEALYLLYQAPEKDPFLMQYLCTHLGIDKNTLLDRAEKMLRKIVFEYGSFDVITLDKFTHRIVRTFAKEFELPQGFEVELDSKRVLKRVVHSIINQIGQDEFITQLLFELSITKMNQGLSWDVQTDLDDFASLLLNENDRLPLSDLRKKDRATHQKDQEKIKKSIKKTEDRIHTLAINFLKFLDENGFERGVFMRDALHKHLEVVQSGKFEKLYENQLESMLKGDRPLYKKATDQATVDQIEEQRSLLLHHFFEIKNAVGLYLLLDRTLKFWTPRLVLQEIEKGLEAYQNENQIRLLGEFNRKISALVQAEQAPYIFARLGERYQHFYLDEFQDTSSLQWSNLVPLIGNALEGETLDGTRGSLLLVGDPKQAIYRWRGGDIQQFVNLLNKKSNPFQVAPWIKRLEVNYRSAAAIVEFNNAFFLHVAQALHSPEIESIYGTDSQQQVNLPGGFVQIKAVGKGAKQDEKKPLYISETLNAVAQAMANQYSEKEIAVLVRTKDQAVAIGAELIAEGYNIVSSDSLEVLKSPQVQLLIAILKLFDQPEQITQHKIILDRLWEFSEVEKTAYFEFVDQTVLLSTAKFFKAIQKQFSISFNPNEFDRLPLVEKVDYLVESFPFLDSNDAFVSSFMEDVFEFSRSCVASLATYIKHWEEQAEKLRLASPENKNAIRVMTIHQAKGLEFPVVILPFMDTPINPNITEKIWYSFKETELEEVQWGWFNFSKKLPLFGTQAEALYKEQLVAKQFDALNVLYVALTRAKDQLYIITQEVSESTSPTNYAQLFSSFVLDQGKVLDENTAYESGEQKEKSSSKSLQEEPQKINLQLGISNRWKNKIIVPSLINEEVHIAQKKGVLLHDVLAKIRSREELTRVLEEEHLKQLPEEEFLAMKSSITQLIQHPELNVLFEGSDQVFCEKELLIPNQPILRPDRMNISKEGKVTILDYKTGKPKAKHQEQIEGYAEVMKQFGYKQVETKLVYIDQDVQVVTINQSLN